MSARRGETPPCVLYLNPCGAISGAERSLLAMLDSLDRTHWTPVVAAPDGPLLAEVAARGVRALPVPFPTLRRPRSVGDWWAMGRQCQAACGPIWRAVRQVRPALIHANSTPAMLCAPVLALTRVPLIWHVRDLVPLGPPGRLAYALARRVVAISRAVAADLRQYAADGGRKITVLPPAVDTTHFHPVEERAALRAALGLPPAGPLIGLVAQFVPWKRHDLLLDALTRLGQRPWHAVLAGADFGQAPDYVAHLRQRFAAPPLAGRVTWLPWLQDAAPLYAALDLCALTSQHEPFGRALIEAAACGVPAVSVAEGGPCDIIVEGATGLLVPAEAGAFADALAALLDDPPRRARLGHAARARAEAHYSLPRHAAALDTLYRQVLAR